MEEYKFLKEWDNVEETTKKIMEVFSPWEKRNLAIVYGKREQTTEDIHTGFHILLLLNLPCWAIRT